jgi:hypothetical protein
MVLAYQPKKQILNARNGQIRQPKIDFEAFRQQLSQNVKVGFE